MSLEISTNGNIKIDNIDTGLGVTQSEKGTVVYVREISQVAARSLGCEPVNYREIQMPQRRYSLAHCAPASGNPGRNQFEVDLRNALLEQ